MVHTFHALGDGHRLRIVELLRDGPQPVGVIGERLQLAQPQVSKHLKVLRTAGLVAVEARAQQRIYALAPATFAELHGWLERYRALWDERFDALEQVLADLETQESR
ncbi:MAG: metalloregulator ArsR/SmtB family transcription factor [Myxococcota bacterium]